MLSYAYNGDGQMSSATDWAGNVSSFGLSDYVVNQLFTPRQAFVQSVSGSGGGSSSTAFYEDLSGRDVLAQSEFSSSAASQGTCATSAVINQEFSAYQIDSISGATLSNGSRNPDGQITEDYDAYSDSCSNTVNVERNYSYDTAGRVEYQGTTAQGGSASNFAYDASGNLTTISSHDSVGNFDTYTQTFDNAGETLSQTPISGSHGSSSTYTYDSLGDQITATTAGTTSTYGFDQAAQMTSYKLGSNSTTYTYTGNNLTGAVKPSNSSITSQYLWNTASGSLPLLISDGTNYYVYGAAQTPIEQYNITSSPPANNPVFMTYVPDNSSWIIASTSGTLLNYYRYDAYGNSSNGTVGSPFGYAGQYTDSLSSNPSGLSYMRARWYSPQIGNFSARDPDFEQTDEAFSYTEGDPVNRRDATGLSDLVTETCDHIVQGFYLLKICVELRRIREYGLPTNELLADVNFVSDSGPLSVTYAQHVVLTYGWGNDYYNYGSRVDYIDKLSDDMLYGPVHVDDGSTYWVAVYFPCVLWVAPEFAGIGGWLQTPKKTLHTVAT